jgi:hypothetical protein
MMEIATRTGSALLFCQDLPHRPRFSRRGVLEA